MLKPLFLNLEFSKNTVKKNPKYANKANLPISPIPIMNYETLFDYCMKENPSLRTEVRYLVKIGERKKDVARKLGLKYDKVISWTKDIRKKKYYPPEVKEEVRKRVKNGEMKSQVARDMGLNTSTVTLWTSKTGRDEWVLNLTEKQLTILNDILANGYTFPADYGIANIKQIYHKFSKNLPIRVVAIRDNSIYYLEGREDEAFEAFMGRYGGKVVSYHRLGKMDSTRTNYYRNDKQTYR